MSSYRSTCSKWKRRSRLWSLSRPSWDNRSRPCPWKLHHCPNRPITALMVGPMAPMAPRSSASLVTSPSATLESISGHMALIHTTQGTGTSSHTTAAHVNRGRRATWRRKPVTIVAAAIPWTHLITFNCDGSWGSWRFKKTQGLFGYGWNILIIHSWIMDQCQHLQPHCLIRSKGEKKTTNKRK